MELLVPKPHTVSCSTTGITEYFNSERVPYPLGAPSVHAGRILYCPAVDMTSNILRHLQGSSVFQVRGDAPHPEGVRG